jgi:hypothetical protein
MIKMMPMPTFCPYDECDDGFPKHPSMTLRKMIKKRNDELKKARGNETAAVVYKQSIFICLQIREELRKEKYLDLHVKTWPVVNFPQLSERVLLMKAEIGDIIENEKIRAKSLVYNKLVSAVGGKAKDLRKIASTVIPPGTIQKDSRPG